MHCYFGIVNSLGDVQNHLEGHRISAVVKLVRPLLWTHLAMASSKLSDLAMLNLDEAFAEGYVNGDPVFKKSVSNYLSSDPTSVGAPRLVASWIINY